MDWKSANNAELIRAFLLLRSPDEARRFLRDIMTKDEIAEFGRRLRAAEMLTKKIPYVAIEKETGLSSTTVARVAKWLNGKGGGYRRVIARLDHHYRSYRTGKGLS